MATVQPLTKSSDPLASLRIDRTQQPRRPARRTGKLIGMLILGLVAAGGTYLWMTYGDRLLRTEVKAVAVEVRAPGVADSVLSAQGYLKSRRQAAIGAKTPGRIVEMKVQEGATVKPGQEIAILDHADLDASLAAMAASLDAMQASLEKSKADLAEVESMLEQDQRDYDRSDQLYRTKALSASEFERAKIKLKTSSIRCASLGAAVILSRARLKEAEARMHETEQQIENLRVRAPVVTDPPFVKQWTVISKDAEVGETIMVGGMGGTSGRGSVVTLADMDNLEVEADVKEDYVGRIHEKRGDLEATKATIAVDAVQDRRYKGSVRVIIKMGDRARGTIKVKVTIEDADDRLFPEMAATVNFLAEGKEVQSGKAEPQVYAPSAAVKKDDNGHFVWQIVNNLLHRVTVETGDTRDGRVLIQRGLKGGEQLVSDPADSLKEDLPVRVVP